jgi:hypothetical protein
MKKTWMRKAMYTLSAEEEFPDGLIQLYSQISTLLVEG